MTWPPAVLPIDFENATPQENTHPDAHNTTNQTINNDIVPEINQKLALSGGTVTGDLQVEGLTKMNGLNVVAPGGSGSSATNPNITLGTSGVNAQTGFYRNSAGAIQVACEGEAVARFGLEQLRLYNNLRVDGTINGTLAFGVADGINTTDILERAETATMPIVDDEGVEFPDSDAESLTVNEVITALLVKVTELAARIEALEAAV
jgi:hypothetical protein